MEVQDQLIFLQKLQDGDLQAFEQLYRDTRAWLVVVAITIVKEEAIAEEIVQDFFINCWKEQTFTGTTFTRLDALKAYLHRYIKNVSLNVYRKESTRKKRIAEIMIPEDHVLQNDLLEPEELTNRISSALDSLTPREQTSFVLAYIHQKTRREIASQMQVSENTVKTQLRIALKKMREVLNLTN